MVLEVDAKEVKGWGVASEQARPFRVCEVVGREFRIVIIIKSRLIFCTQQKLHFVAYL